ncbi:MAG: PKD domain-containing protein [Halobacteriota archaeon]
MKFASLVLSLILVLSAIGGATATTYSSQSTSVDAPQASQSVVSSPSEVRSNVTDSPSTEPPSTDSTSTDSPPTESTAPSRPVATGFFDPRVDGVLYGVGDDALPEGKVSEWADADERAVALNALETSDRKGSLFTKSVHGDVYVGLRVPGGLDDLTWVALQVDRDDDGSLSPGDVRYVPITDPKSEIDALPSSVALKAQVYRDGAFRDLELKTDLPVTRWGTLSYTADGDDTPFSVEARLDHETLNRALDTEDEDTSRLDYSLVVETRTDRYGVNGEPVRLSKAYANGYLVPDYELALPTDDLSVDHIEVTQSVQTRSNSLPLVREKETLARVFVEHDNPSDTDVEVSLDGYAIESGSVTSLGTLTQTHTAPAGTLDRAEESHSANFELPADWSDAELLVLVSKVRRPGYIEVSSSDNTGATAVAFHETLDPTIYYVRVNVGSESSPWRSSTANVDLATDTFADVYPVADPTFVEVDSDVVGAKNGADSDEVIQDMNEVALGIILASAIAEANPSVDPVPLPSQVFGFTPDRAGTSDPAWYSSSGASMASIGSVSGSAHDRLIMAHEVNHNLGNDSWGHHNGNGSWDNGCNAGSDADWSRLHPTNTHVQEVGWDPSVGVIPPEYPEFQSYCQIWEVSTPWPTDDPAQWISDYRWVRLFDRFQNWDHNPVHPDLRDGSSGGDTAADKAAGKKLLGTEVPTARIVSGTLSRDGRGRLSPSFEQPGLVPESLRPRAVKDPRAHLFVRYSDGSTESFPVSVDFESAPTEAEDAKQWPFSVALQDNGTIQSIRLVSAETEQTLDTVESTGWSYGGSSFALPERFERNASTEIGVQVKASSETTLRKRLMYTPDGVTLYPYGPSFTESEYTAGFEDLPGGEEAQFVLLVSDGVQTKLVESPTFAVPHAPPTVSIDRNERWVRVDEPTKQRGADSTGTTDGEPDDRSPVFEKVTRPVETTVGARVALDAAGQDEFGRELSGKTLRWSVVDQNGERVSSVEQSTGTRFAHRFTKPGTYTVSVVAIDPETELTATDSIQVRVSTPPLPTQTEYDAFEKASASPSTTTHTVDVVLSGAPNGLQLYNVTVAAPDGSSVNETTPDLLDGIQFEVVEGGSDESFVTTRAADITQSVGPFKGDRVLYTVTFDYAGELSESDLELSVNRLVDDSGEPMSPGRVSLDLHGEAVFTEPFSGADGPPADLDGDGLYEDVDGDGQATFSDAISLAFVDSSDLSPAQVLGLDFDGDGDLDFIDAISLAFAV